MLKAALIRVVMAHCTLICAVSCSAQSPTPEQVEFFEKRVRPVLANRCYSCHSAQQQFANVRLDSPVFLSNPTPKGPKLVAPGDPSKSALILTVRYDGAVRMPPTGKIPQKEIDALTQWVKTGAAWPPEKQTGVNDAVTTKKALEQASKLWSLQPVKKPAIPVVQDSDWIKNPIDAFVLSKLESKNLHPSKPADRRTLLRRASYDLIGLPPTPNEIAEFEKDGSSNAWEKVIDRLLASPHYGERWGRQWLDIARYADTKGGAFFGAGGDESRYPFAHSYRDWVIQAFNDDMSYPQFLQYQIAADKMNLGEDKRHLAALGFLTLGRRNQGDMQDLIDDRIDVVMRGTQALTVSCARCHDHKFDPIPTKDYYSLYGVFSASNERTVMLADASSQMPGVAESVKTFEREKKAREGRIDRFLEAKRLEILAHARTHITEYLLAAEDPLDRQSGGEETISGLKTQFIAQWKQFLLSTRKSGNPALIPWNAFMTLPSSQWQAKTPALAARFAADKSINPLIAKAFAGAPPASRSEIASRYATVFAAVDSKWQRTLKSAKERGNQAPNSLPDRWEEQIRQILYNPEIVQSVAQQTEALLKEADRNRLQALRLNVQRLLESPSSPQHALVLADSGNMPNPRVLIRGDLATPGEEVPRRFLLALAGEKREPFKDGSGRLELARAIASPDNPLTCESDGEPSLAGAFRAGNRPHSFRLRHARRTADPPRTP